MSGTGKTALSKKTQSPAVVIWVVSFVLFPLGVWLIAASRSGFHGMTVSNISLEPALVALLSVAVFLAWYLVAGKGLTPSTGIVLLIILSAVALALQRFVPALRE